MNTYDLTVETANSTADGQITTRAATTLAACNQLAEALNTVEWMVLEHQHGGYTMVRSGSVEVMRVTARGSEPHDAQPGASWLDEVSSGGYTEYPAEGPDDPDGYPGGGL